ncbi:putative inner membrane protein translocase component YidC [Brucella vulpis]|uniref:membrane protein insertase YidC n=1 Tax=Brucella vulpis TaxID=981386 RepID=UPI00073A8975|nr:putative inner membrane protein translocase component YidC [Brucella vulpis]CUW51564.1 putative inner membrane protein translocase component YidC [Brucella vulpis]
MENKRNFFITIALSILILALWQVFYLGPKTEAQREQARIEEQQRQAQQAAQNRQASSGTGDTPQMPANPDSIPGQGDTKATGAPLTRDAAIAQSPRIEIDTPSLRGSINLTGARLDDLYLKKYHETVSDKSPEIELLAPSSLKQGYFVELGFTGNDATGAVPSPNTVWVVEGNNKLTPSTPVTLTYTNDKNLTFKRVISVDDAYMFTVDDTIINDGGSTVSLASYGRVTRFNQPEHASATYVLHEGLIGVMGQDGLQEIKYAKIEDNKDISFKDVIGGWVGITDKYWAATLIPPQDEKFTGRFSHFTNDRPRYQSDLLSAPLTVAPGQSQTIQNRVFAGAKVVNRIQNYETKYHIKQFDLLIDWGWFYFITKPMFYLIDWIYKFTGNFGVAILVVTVLLKALFFPLANKSYKSMARMKLMQPKMTEIREKYADDKMKQQQAMMELYKREKINPLAGCWPVLVQIPVFFALYKVLYVTIEMRHAPFFGWIQDLAAPDPTSIFNLFGLLPYTVPHFLMIGVWPIIMGITMFLQMRMNPTPPDPTQAAIFTWMPIIFTFMLASFPAGLVIYWAWNNTLSIIQQSVIMKRQGVEIELFDNLKGLFRRKPKEANK